MKLAFSKAPPMLYLATDPALGSAMKMASADTAMPKGLFNPVSSDALSVEPLRLYSPTVLLVALATNN